jgi:hypothetical protein
MPDSIEHYVSDEITKCKNITTRKVKQTTSNAHEVASYVSRAILKTNNITFRKKNKK